ncbi:MAG: hypothetical protein HC860_03080 [Alkalinema sp. RU_4_3]|nr:hypothetical protein [Alkalinema sp. RU_4_3]
MTGFDRLPGELSDYRLNQYFLEHTWKMVSDHTYTGKLYGPSMFTPYPNTLAFSDNLFGAAPIYWLLRFFLMPDIASMGWLMVLSLLNFLSMLFILRKENVQPALAGLGGFLFAFPLSRVAQYAHAQLFPQFCTPLCLWLVWRFALKPSKLGWLLILITLYWQILCGIYLGWFLLLVTLIFSIVTISVLPESRQKVGTFLYRCWSFVALSLGVWAFLLYKFLQPYLEMKRIMGGNSYDVVAELLLKPISLFMVPAANSLWSPILGSLHHLLGVSDPNAPILWIHYNFPGSVLMILTGMIVYKFLRKKTAVFGNQKRLVLAFTITGLIVAFCATDFGHGVSLWRLIYQIIPGASAIRAPIRIFLTLLPCLIIAGIIFLNEYLKTSRLSQSATKYLIACIIVLAIFEQRTIPYTYDAASVRAKDAELGQVTKQYCQAAYISPFNQRNEELSFVSGIYAQVDAMWAGINANVPVVNGYSGYSPPGFLRTWQDKQPIIDWLSANKSKPIDRLCFISRYPPKTEPGIQVLETHQSTHYIVQVIRYPQRP